ncbi:MAG: hypothetical protein KF819_15380 [Labilithrix sp.]|nr:hypothetical protein [Labilithrix sp.]
MRSTLTCAAIGALIVACGSPRPAVAPEPAAGAATTGSDVEAPTATSESVEPAEPQPTACTKDSHCTLSMFAGCCVCCPSRPRAFFKPELAKLEAKCGSVRCPSCFEDCQAAVDITTYVASCVDGRCVAEPR